MQLVTRREPYVERILRQTAPAPGGRFGALVPGAPIAVPAARRLPADTPVLAGHAVAALARLVSGEGELLWVDRADPALVETVGGRTYLYHLETRRFIAAGVIDQPPQSADLFAARLLLGRAPDLCEAYARLLEAHADPSRDAELPALLATASDELVVAIERDLGIDEVAWWKRATADELATVADDPVGLPLRTLFTDAATFRSFLAGRATAYANMTNRIPALAGAARAYEADEFVGPQFARTLRYMSEPKAVSVLHIGPTGTAKSTCWRKCMESLDPAFDARTYPYRLSFAAGTEGVDLVGKWVNKGNGVVVWHDGLLVRAMRDGRRLLIDELNRCRAAELNVLLSALQEGIIVIEQHEDEIVVAEEGFAIDGTCNVGEAYVGTDELDPAVVNRFPRKVLHDYLEEDQEVALLQSRNPALAESQARSMVRAANEVRAAWEGDGALDVDGPVSPRSLLHSAALVAAGSPIPDAVEATWLFEVAHRGSARAKREMVMDRVRAHAMA